MVRARAVVFDIEGTVCPISFVKEVLFPYAVQKIHSLVRDLPASSFPLSSSSDNVLISQYLSQFPSEYTGDAKSLLDHIDDLVARDVKASYLKTLQGYLWKSGYDSGEIKAPVYPDAVSHIQKWAKSLPSDGGVYIYSSGSVAAQILLFAHCEPDLDLTPYLKDYFDTVNAGQKVVPDSYNTIAKKIGLPASDILFFTDNTNEIDAAQKAGWQTTLVVRPGNAPFDDSYRSKTTVITSLDQVDLN
ncbi:putative acireductone synthase UTR4 [Sugiyamaella lignohabitans]|uniref:Putative acireductone synthase UTR4 n=1 Tax=Sugiyamaella lignohabitans TaxID=796027 RepID=A0A167EJ17_9ASCO|nr:putative acireductone synthase UTR4 [Sugiyamaella lignohabitans]ANB14138.1 putative acireductone synthase UTR4 [Sugiyamaella lignohabitans]